MTSINPRIPAPPTRPSGPGHSASVAPGSSTQKSESMPKRRTQSGNRLAYQAMGDGSG